MLDPQAMISLNKSLMAFNLIYLFEKRDLMKTVLADLSAMELGKPVVGHLYSFDDIPNALREFQGGRTIGKLVIRL